jgi:hypothetical protein
MVFDYLADYRRLHLCKQILAAINCSSGCNVGKNLITTLTGESPFSCYCPFPVGLAGVAGSDSLTLDKKSVILKIGGQQLDDGKCSGVSMIAVCSKSSVRRTLTVSSKHSHCQARRRHGLVSH